MREMMKLGGLLTTCKLVSKLGYAVSKTIPMMLNYRFDLCISYLFRK